MEGELTVMEGLAQAVQTALTTIGTILTSVIEMAISNPLVMIFVAGGFVGLAIGIFRKLKKVAK